MTLSLLSNVGVCDLIVSSFRFRLASNSPRLDVSRDQIFIVKIEARC